MTAQVREASSASEQGGFFVLANVERCMNADEREHLDESFRALAIGFAMLDKAEENPAFRKWLEAFVDQHVLDDDRSLFGFLTQEANAQIIPFILPSVP